MAFQEKLTDKITKERGGRHGGKGHEFQRYWALCHLLKLDLAQDDYVLLVEFIEDVAVLNADSNPTALDLFQLKKKDGGKTWTKAALSNPSKDSISVLAKLFESQRVLPEADATIAFVSNASVVLPLASEMDSTSQAEFAADCLEDSLKQELRAAIAGELSCNQDDIKWEKLRFVKCPLALDELETHAKGRVVEYLERKFPNHNARADVFCKALYAEITIRATDTRDAASFDELRSLRGISKAQFDDMLAVTLARKPIQEVLDEAINFLVQENVPFPDRNAIKNSSRRYIVERAGQRNFALPALEQKIELLRNDVPSDLVSNWQVINWIYEQLQQSNDWHSYAALDKPYVLAMALYGISK